MNDGLGGRKCRRLVNGRKVIAWIKALQKITQDPQPARGGLAIIGLSAGAGDLQQYQVHRAVEPGPAHQQCLGFPNLISTPSGVDSNIREKAVYCGYRREDPRAETFTPREPERFSCRMNADGGVS